MARAYERSICQVYHDPEYGTLDHRLYDTRRHTDSLSESLNVNHKKSVPGPIGSFSTVLPWLLSNAALPVIVRIVIAFAYCGQDWQMS